MRQYIFPFLILFFISSLSPAQNWVDKMQSPHANLYEIQKEFNSYFLLSRDSGKENNEKGEEYEPYKRWENFVSPRVYPSGNLSQLNNTLFNYKEYLKILATSGNAHQKMTNANWVAMGPNGPISNGAGGPYQKSGRLNFITLNPKNMKFGPVLQPEDCGKVQMMGQIGQPPLMIYKLRVAQMPQLILLIKT
jgi:hypothetical protein